MFALQLSLTPPVTWYILQFSTNHVYLHRPNAFGVWQPRLHLCYETLKRVWHEPKRHILRLPLFANFDL